MSAWERGKEAYDIFLLRRGYARYEFVRTLSAREFSELFNRSISGEGQFDDLVDEAIIKWRAMKGKTK